MKITFFVRIARPQIEKIGHFAKKRCLLDKNHIHYKCYRAHNPVPGRDRIVVDFDLVYLGDADIQVQADFHIYKVLETSNFLKAYKVIN